MKCSLVLQRAGWLRRKRKCVLDKLPSGLSFGAADWNLMNQ